MANHDSQLHLKNAEAAIAQGERSPEVLVDLLRGLCEVARQLLEKSESADRRGKESEQRKERLLWAAEDAGKVGLWSMDDLANLRSVCSESYYRIYGRPPRPELPGLDEWLSWIHPDDRALARGSVADSIATGKSLKIRYRAYWPDSSEHWIEVKGETTRDSSGSVTGIMGVVIDVTDNVELERKVQAQRKALEAGAKMAAIGQMAAGIAHEINNPLAIILGNIRQMALMLSKQGSLDPEYAKVRIERVSRTAERIVKIVSALRSLSRAGENDPAAPVRLDGVLGDVIELARQQFQLKSVALHFQSPGEIKILGRDVELGQVFVNLLNNALDAVADKDNAWVKIEVAVLAKRVLISVTDSGSGIPSEIADKLAEPFYTTKPPEKGTGLGLSISKRLVEEHGGHLRLDRESENTRFVVELPMM